jgi:hypothetical protein
MLLCSLERPTGTISGHICPVPSCGRRHDGERYFDEEQMVAVSQRSGPANRQAAARSAILSAIGDPPTAIVFNLASVDHH